MDIQNDTNRPAHYLDGIEAAGALMSPPAYNFVINRMVDFARHYTEVMKDKNYGESYEDAEKRLFGYELKVV